MNREKTSWNNVRARVAQVNKPLADAIDKLDPDSNLLPLEIGTFQYGDEIISPDNPQTFLPIQKSCELFFEFEKKPKIFTLFQPGELALPEYLTPNQPQSCTTQDWKITAGARSALMPAKISDYEGHKKIRKALQIDIDKPDHFHNQWGVFKEISQSKHANSKWECDVLFFDRAWGEHMYDPAWQAFQNLINQKYQKNHKAHIDLTNIKRAIGRVQHDKMIHFPLVHAEAMLHLLSLGLGHTPGFRTAKNENDLPLKLLQSTYTELYGLKNYAPIILTPSYFDWTNPKETPLYSSFNYSTSHYISPKTNQAQTNVKALEALIWTYKKLHGFLMNQDFLAENSEMHQFLQSCEYTFYHNNGDFASPDLIHQQDSTLMKGWNTDQFRFPVHSAFWQGCVGITRQP